MRYDLLLYTPPTLPPPRYKYGEVCWNHFVCLSGCSSVRVSDRVRSISSEPLNHFFKTKLGMVVYFHRATCHVEKMVHYLQCQGHSKSLNKQNITISIISSKLLFHLQPNLV